ncbi:hypothetical protein B0H12DRAFT_1329394 [Mycena haematopus]|nr:hypothetical protein B0H12DRAFT_1329394 [Mycena haematopus]
MSLSYLADDPAAFLAAAPHDERPTGGIHFQLPRYLLDAPPTLAPGGGAEALHPAHAAAWFANNGFDRRAQYFAGYSAYHGLVQDAVHSLETLTAAFPPYPWLHAPAPDEPLPLTGSGLPVYSQSGFDIVSLLARVQNRANPSIDLGPVDFTTSFVVVDVRRHDDPIVYCSPSFCALTGYAERDILGRNCRFLQAPPSPVLPPLSKGDLRQHTSPPPSARSRRPSAFVNLVSVVPLFGEHADDPSPTAECVWFVGFQIDLTAQSEGIVERVRDGRYYAGAVSQARRGLPAPQNQKPEVAPAPQRERRTTAVPAPRVSPVLAHLLSSPRFLKSCGIPHPPAPHAHAGAVTGLPPDPSSHALHALLLEQLPDFVHVLSLKGAFLYVAPAVTRVLGWTPAELVGRAIADLCFSRDVVSVGRALKEASLPVEGVRIQQEGDKEGPSIEQHKHEPSRRQPYRGTRRPAGADPAEALRAVDLVFRARTKQGAWVWVECRGRLHVEPGKGRKAIVLIGRARGMARVPPGTRFSGAPRGWARCAGESREKEFEASGYDAYSASPENYFAQPTSPTFAIGQPMYAPAQGHGFPTRSPTGSVSGLEFALVAKRARIEVPPSLRNKEKQRLINAVAGRQHPSPPCPHPWHQHAHPRRPSPAFHGLIDPHGLLLSVGAGVRALLGYDPLALRGTRLGALVARSRRLSDVGAVSELDRVLREWREAGAYPSAFAAPLALPASFYATSADSTSAPASGYTPPTVAATREVRCTLHGRTGPVDAIVRLVAPLPDRPGALPPAVAPPRLMYAVWLAGADTRPLPAARPHHGGSWQYELQQLRIANARLEEEIAELERAEEERAAVVAEREREKGKERERERARAAEQARVAAYQQQRQAQQMYGYEHQQWGYPLPRPHLCQSLRRTICR